MLKNILPPILAVLLAAGSAIAQEHVHTMPSTLASPLTQIVMNPHMSAPASFAWTDNKPNCLAYPGPAHNCPHQVGSLLNVSGVSVGSDGTVLVIDSARNVQQYNDYPTNTFTVKSQYGNQMQSLGVGSANYIVGVAATGTVLNQGCTAPNTGNELYKWTGSAWTSFGACVNQASASADGSYCYIDHSTEHAYHLVNGAWAIMSGTGSYQQCYISTGDHGLLVGTDWRLYAFDSTGAVAAVTGVPAGVNGTITGASEDILGNIWISTTNANNAIWRYDQPTATWQNFVFTGVSNWTIGTGGEMETFFVGSTRFGNAIFRFPEETIVYSGQIKGTTTCNPSPCPGTNHAPHADLNWSNTAKQIGGGHQTGPNTPANQTMTSNVYTLSTYDIFDFVDGGMNLVYDFGVDCAIAGADFVHFFGTLVGGPSYIHTADSTFHNSVQNTCVVNGNYLLPCTFPVTPACSNLSGGQLPDFDVNWVVWNSGQDDPSKRHPSYMSASGLCISLTGHQPYKCTNTHANGLLAPNAALADGKSVSGPFPCDYNP